MYKLYKILNKVNKKLYIGITKLELSQRLSQHIKQSHTPKYPLQRAIKKYGVESFSIELIKEANKKPKSKSTRQKMSKSAIINQNGKRFQGRNGSCLCCRREWDIGNLTQHINRRFNNNVI